MTTKQCVDKVYKQFFLNAEGNISFTKLALQLAGAGAAIASFPASMAAVGITVALPPILVLASKYATGIGFFVATVRAKDTIDAGKIPTEQK